MKRSEHNLKVYIAGKITGNPNYKNKFHEAEQALHYEGHLVLNPADLPQGMSNADYMKICFAMIDAADVVAFLPDWKESKGASLENAYCQYVSKQTMYLADLTSYQAIVNPEFYGF